MNTLQPNFSPASPVVPNRRTSRWGSLPLTHSFDVDGKNGLDRLPIFERVSPKDLGMGDNPNFDMVMRRPGPGSPLPVPVGIVSKSYRLVQHRELLERVFGYAAKIPGAAPVKARAEATLNGERAMFRINLGEQWEFDPDGKKMGLQILCRNSVDGSSAMRLQLGWFRFVCSNGLVVGVTLGRLRMVHAEHADMDLAFEGLERQLEIAKTERESLHRWAKEPVSIAAIQAWADSAVAEKWNILSAARVWHICRSGQDAKFSPPFEKAPPTRRKVKLTAPVPGAPPVATTLYDVAQGLSWVASRRSDLDEAEAHQRDIGPLLEKLQHG